MTTEIKNKIFSQYIYQYVNSDKGLCKLRDIDFIESLSWIELKSLENMTESDLNIINKIFTEDNKISKNDLIKHVNDAHLNNYYRKNAFNGIEMIDILRQMGYATGFTILLNDEPIYHSVEDLVELGIYKLI